MLKKKILSVALCGACVLSMSATAFAMTPRATGSFEFDLPAHNGDVQTSTIAKESDGGHFSVKGLTIGEGTDKVCTWTELSTGLNLSDPYTQVSAGDSDVDYDEEQGKGTRIRINFDNPIDMNTTVAISGKWTPN